MSTGVSACLDLDMLLLVRDDLARVDPQQLGVCRQVALAAGMAVRDCAPHAGTTSQTVTIVTTAASFAAP